jgi:hypothetical protein
MATIITRETGATAKGSPLTNAELDANFVNLNTEVSTKIAAAEKGTAGGVATLGVDGKVPSTQLPNLDYVPNSEKGAVNGVATLDDSGKVPATQLPSYVDDVVEAANLAAFPATGETGKIYVALDTNKTYRWSGSTYVFITSGAVDSVAGKTGVVTLAKGDVGLGNVENKSSLTIRSEITSTNVTGALGYTPQTPLVSGTNIKTVNGESVLGSGNIQITSEVTSVAGKTGVVTLAKGDVGLGNVDNTSDANKPISTAQQTALNLKAPKDSPTFTGLVNLQSDFFGETATVGGDGFLTASFLYDSSIPATALKWDANWLKEKSILKFLAVNDELTFTTSFNGIPGTIGPVTISEIISEPSVDNPFMTSYEIKFYDSSTLPTDPLVFITSITVPYPAPILSSRELRIPGALNVGGELLVNGVPVGSGGAFNICNTSNIVSCIGGSGGTGTHNFFAGSCAGASNTTGYNNTFIGDNAGASNTYGGNNNFFGRYAGRYNTEGCNNTFIGDNAGASNTTASNNIFIGALAGRLNTTGDNNNFFGSRAGARNTTGCGNNFFGCSGIFSTTGSFNNFFGFCAGNSNSTGSYNNFFGRSAGRSNSTSGNNNFFGQCAGFSQCGTGPGGNTFIGTCAGFSNINGGFNNFIGRFAGLCNTSGNYNNFIGNFTGRSNTTGSNNNFIGSKAGYNTTTGLNNTYIGQEAGCSNTTGSNNLIIGNFAGPYTDSNIIHLQAGTNSLQVSSAGCLTVNGSPVGGGGGEAFSVVPGYGGFPNIYSCVSGTNAGTYSSNNFFVGYCAGKYAFNGTDNTFIGRCAGGGNYSGNNNNFFGAYSGGANFSGCYNNFLGRDAGRNNTSGSHNNFFGCRSGRCNTSGTGNNFFGYNAGERNTAGNHNTFIGANSGKYNGTGVNNIYIGCDAGRYADNGNNNIIMGSYTGCFALTNTIHLQAGTNCLRLTGSGCLTVNGSAVGGGASPIRKTITCFGGVNYVSDNSGFNQAASPVGTYGKYSQDNFIVGYASACYLGDGNSGANIIIGRYAGECASFALGSVWLGSNTGMYNSTGTNNTFIGAQSGRSNTSGSSNLFMGVLSGRNNTTGSNNNFLGKYTGRYNTTGTYNNFIGFCAGYYNTTGVYNNFIGRFAGRGNTEGNANNFFGTFAGGNNTTGSNNNYIGCAAGGYGSGSGSNNNYIGCTTGYYNTTGSFNNFMGCRAGYCNSTGNNNIFFGNSAGFNNTTSSCNVFVGINAGCNNTTGCNNIAFGSFSGTTGSTVCGLFNLTSVCNRIVMGNFNHTCAQIKIAWTATSDIRDKYIFGSVPHGRGFLQNIETIEYAFKDRETGCITDPDGKRRYGFSAQNVLAAESDKPVIVSTEDPENLQITSDYIVPVLVNAVKELSQELEQIKVKLANLEAKQ